MNTYTIRFTIDKNAVYEKIVQAADKTKAYLSFAFNNPSHYEILEVLENEGEN